MQYKLDEIKIHINLNWNGQLSIWIIISIKLPLYVLKSDFVGTDQIVFSFLISDLYCTSIQFFSQFKRIKRKIQFLATYFNRSLKPNIFQCFCLFCVSATWACCICGAQTRNRGLLEEIQRKAQIKGKSLRKVLLYVYFYLTLYLLYHCLDFCYLIRIRLYDFAITLLNLWFAIKWKSVVSLYDQDIFLYICICLHKIMSNWK